MKDKLLRLKELSDRLNELLDGNLRNFKEIESFLSQECKIRVSRYYYTETGYFHYGQMINSGEYVFFYRDKSTNTETRIHNLSRDLKIKFGEVLPKLLDLIENEMINLLKTLEGNNDQGTRGKT